MNYNVDITLSGLTTRQVKLLNKMWSKDSVDEFDAWCETLQAKTLREVLLLREIILIEIIEAEAIKNVNVAKEAKELIERVK